MTRHIQLRDGRLAIVDDQDYEALNQWRWHADVHGYAVRTVKSGGRNRVVFMHREIVGAIGDTYVDHANHNKLDNRRTNLRMCTKAENQRNQLKHRDGKNPYKGVQFEPRTGRWAASIWLDGHNRGLGAYSTPEAAAQAYDAAAREHFGTFALTNFSTEGEG